MIQLTNVDRVYPLKGGPFYALRGISLGIEEGDFVSIMGPSGSGKSTLLNILGLHDSAWSGEYRFGTTNVHGLNQKQRLELQKKNIGFVFQSYHLLDDLTVYENLEIPLSYRDVPKAERQTIVCDALDRFHIVAKKDLFPSQLSGGSLWRSPARSWRSPASSSPTSRPATSIPTRAAKSWSSSAS